MSNLECQCDNIDTVISTESPQCQWCYHEKTYCTCYIRDTLGYYLICHFVPLTTYYMVVSPLSCVQTSLRLACTQDLDQNSPARLIGAKS